MAAVDLSTLGAGFSDLAIGSQTVFRAALHALSHPGRIVPVPHDAKTPAAAQPASAAILLALVDPDCKVWMSPTLAQSDAPSWLRFHTGCALINDHRLAQFLWVARGDPLPAFGELRQGSDADPDQGATVVIDVAGIDSTAAEGAWRLTGPGIQAVTRLSVDGLPAQFVEDWRRNHAAFPCGIDVFLACESDVVGLPRTTTIEAIASAALEA